MYVVCTMMVQSFDKYLHADTDTDTKAAVISLQQYATSDRRRKNMVRKKGEKQTCLDCNDSIAEPKTPNLFV